MRGQLSGGGCSGRVRRFQTWHVVESYVVRTGGRRFGRRTGQHLAVPVQHRRERNGMEAPTVRNGGNRRLISSAVRRSVDSTLNYGFAENDGTSRGFHFSPCHFTDNRSCHSYAKVQPMNRIVVAIVLSIHIHFKQLLDSRFRQ